MPHSWMSSCCRAVTEDDVLKGKQSIKTQAVAHQNSESDASLDADDDTLSSLEEKELENFTGMKKNQQHNNWGVPSGVMWLFS